MFCTAVISVQGFGLQWGARVPLFPAAPRRCCWTPRSWILGTCAWHSSNAAGRVTGDAESLLQVVQALVSSAALVLCRDLPRCRRTLCTVVSPVQQLQIHGLGFSPGFWMRWWGSRSGKLGLPWLLAPWLSLLIALCCCAGRRGVAFAQLVGQRRTCASFQLVA